MGRWLNAEDGWRSILGGGWGGGLLSKLVGGRVGTLCRDCLACPRSREESGRSLCPKPSESGPASVPLTSVLHAAQSRCAHMQPPARALDSPILQLPRLRLGRLKPRSLNHQIKGLHPAPPPQSAADGGRDAYTRGGGVPSSGGADMGEHVPPPSLLRLDPGSELPSPGMTPRPAQSHLQEIPPSTQ